MNLLIQCIFNIFLSKKIEKWFFFLLSWHLYIWGFDGFFSKKRHKNKNFESSHTLYFQPNFSKMILRRPYHVYLSAFQLLWQRKCTSQKWYLEGRNVFIYKYKAQSMSTIGFSAFSQRKWISQKWQLEGRIMFIYKYKSKLLQLSAFLRHWQRKCTSQ